MASTNTSESTGSLACLLGPWCGATTWNATAAAGEGGPSLATAGASMPYQVFKTARGVLYTPLWKAVPWLEPTYTRYEKAYDAAPAVMFMHDHAWVPVLSVVLYLCFVRFGPLVMSTRKAFDLRGVLAVWNLGLAVVSLVGAFRVGSHLLFLLSPWGGFSFRDTLCRSPEESYGDNATGLWCVIFTASKVLELLDTVFVVLRKKKVIFLHWYHHTTVLLVSWFGHVTFLPGLYFIAINYSIHAVMYSYFFLTAMHAVPAWFNPLWITSAQISQMFVGIFVTAMTIYFKNLQPHPLPCAVDDRMLAAVLAMYVSYCVLFVHFYIQRFCSKRTKAKTA